MSCTRRLASRRLRYLFVVVGLLGLILIAAGVAIGVAVPIVFEAEVAKLLVVDSNTTSSYRSLVNQSFNSEDGGDWKLYVLNLTNADAVAAGALPVVKEVGPYWFRKITRPASATFLDGGKTVLTVSRNVYLEHRTSDSSSRDPSEYVTVPNPVYMGIVMQAGGEANLFVQVDATAMAGIASTLTATSAASSMKMAALCSGAKAMFAAELAAHASDTSALFTYWATATSDDTATYNASMRISTSTSSGITVAQAGAIWNNVLATNATLIGAWLTYGSCPLATLLGLADADNTLATNWLLSYVSTVVEPYLATAWGCSGGKLLPDLPYAQWGSGVLGASVQPSLTPEYGVWATANSMPASALVGATLAKTLLPALGNSTQLAIFLTLFSGSSWAALNTAFGVTQLQATGVAAYVIQHVQPVIAVPTFRSTFADSGLFATKPMTSFIFGGADSLYGYLTGKSSAPGLFVNYSTVAMALAANSTILKRTGKGDLSHIGQYLQVDGSSTVSWAQPVAVGGTSGGQFKPFVLQPSKLSVVAWNQDTLRPVKFTYSGSVKVSGILPCSRYVPADGEIYGVNSTFFNSIAGFANMSAAYSGAPIFYSPPHMMGAGKAWRANFSYATAVDEDADPGFFLDVQTFLGTTMRAVTSMQVNVLFDSKWKKMFSVTAPGLQENLMLPVGYLVSSGTATDHDLNLVKAELELRRIALALLPGLVVPGCLFLIAGATLIGYSVYVGTISANAVRPVKLKEVKEDRDDKEEDVKDIEDVEEIS